MNLGLLVLLVQALQPSGSGSSGILERIQTVESEKVLLKNPRPLTLEEYKAGESYPGWGGDWLVYQAQKTPKNPFYQIILWDLSQGRKVTVTPEFVKATCSWPQADRGRILLAATWDDPQAKDKFEKALRQLESEEAKRRYEWDFDEAYELYFWDKATGRRQRLTRQKGYDAEGSLSPDGRYLLWASNAWAYKDPQYQQAVTQRPQDFVDLFEMDLVTRQVRRLTDRLGYDGGPFYSFDGRYITWRYFDPQTHEAQVWVMDRSGNNPKQVTQLPGINWAPFFHPSGDYLIFASNAVDGKDFELFVVDVQGRQKPIRVTYHDGFDGLPVFTPDGMHLLWSRKSGDGTTQIWIAQWNDRLVRQLLGLPARGIDPKDLEYAQRVWKVSDEGVLGWLVEWISDLGYQGRLTATPELRLLIDQMQVFLKRLGYPTRVHEYEIPWDVQLQGENRFQWVAQGQSGQPDMTQWGPSRLSENGSFEGQGMVWIGYGIRLPSSSGETWDDWKTSVPIAQKLVVVRDGIPVSWQGSRRLQAMAWGHLSHKINQAMAHKAAGLMVVVPDSRWPVAEDLHSTYEIPTFFVKESYFEKVTQRWSTPWRQAVKIWDSGNSRALEYNDVTWKLEIHQKVNWAKSWNLEAGDLGAPILLGAHVDHLGRGQKGYSLDPQKNVIHPGADDNASGVALLLFWAYKQAQKRGLKKGWRLAFFSGEELGALGSRAFVEDERKLPRVYLNFDMVGRYRDSLIVAGTKTAAGWARVLEEVLRDLDLHVQLSSSDVFPSDTLSFAAKKVPYLSFFTGAHEQYHTSQDLPSLINLAALLKLANGLDKLIDKILSQKNAQAWAFNESSQVGSSRNVRVYSWSLGILPDYGFQASGVRILGVKKGSLAQKLGLQEGDVIVELLGQPVRNIYDYMGILAQSPGKGEGHIRWIRNGQTQEAQFSYP